MTGKCFILTERFCINFCYNNISLFLWEWGDITVIKRLSTSILFLYTYKTLQKCSSTEIFYWQTAELRFHHCKKLYLLHTKNLCWPCKGFGFYLIWDIFRLLHGSFYIASYITRGYCTAFKIHFPWMVMVFRRQVK